VEAFDPGAGNSYPLPVDFIGGSLEDFSHLAQSET
jgi:hypothetical protein